jgi:hypothetical protein
LLQQNSQADFESESDFHSTAVLELMRTARADALKPSEGAAAR